MAGMKMIVGLGNPGKEYVGTRHNVGFDVIDELARKLSVAVERKKFGGLYGEVLRDDMRIVLVKPQQYMNLSGQVVAATAGFYKLAPTDLMVVADDMALAPGLIRIRAGGSGGGHNGLRDIIAQLGTDQFPRLRIGIGSESGPAMRDFVLSRPGQEDGPQVKEGIRKACEAVECWLTSGISITMNRYNEKNRSADAADKDAGGENKK